MLTFMERATIYYLKQKGWNNTQIAEFTGHHRDTIAKVLKEEVEKKPQKRDRKSAASVFDEQIDTWLDKNVSVKRMLEMARADAHHPYTGSETAFYDYVRKLRRARKQTPHHLAIRFEGLPGEYLQIDWGEVRGLTFTKEGLGSQTRYFFAARLKYSRAMFVSFQQDMREETLLRCLLACFVAIGGVPWVVVTDNMKTAVLGRDDGHQPIWNPAYQKLAAECKFLPEACAPASGNQKGSVENLVKFVKANFLSGRTFHDDADLAEQCQQWLTQVNTERESSATGQVPCERLAEEQRKFGALPQQAHDYGFFDCVVVSREGLVSIETNRYSVPAHLIGRALTARLHLDRIELFADQELVASHPRSRGHHERIITPAHFEAAFATKPRARVMVYRDWLCGLGEAATLYVRELCQRRHADMTQQITVLYTTAQESRRGDFLAALELAAEQQMYGAEYVQAILSLPRQVAPGETAEVDLSALLSAVPAQHEVERDLAQYEYYVANRDSVGAELSPSRGGRP
jgi:transposase